MNGGEFLLSLYFSFHHSFIGGYMSIKEFKWMNVNDLVPWKDNPRHNDDAVPFVVESLQEVDWGTPLVIQANTNMIICGHTRLKAAKHLGMTEVPCTILEITDEKAKIMAIADNKTGEIADWDESKLLELVQDMTPDELKATGFNQDELDALMNDGDYEPAPLPEPPPKVFTDLTFKLLKGNCLERLKELPDNSIDSIVTDPPYELGFMGKSWDSTGIAYSVELWQECLRVLKHGGHLVAFSGSRTVFPMGVAIAEAGFEVRDMISWIYTSGFPKSLDISKAIDQKFGATDQRVKVGTKSSGIANKNEKGRHTIGASKSVEVDITAPATDEAKKWFGWGTGLKPSQEPAVLARKPIDPECKSIAENVLKWGTGGLNIEAGRFAYGDDCWFGSSEATKPVPLHENLTTTVNKFNTCDFVVNNWSENGRWPSNTFHCTKPQKKEKNQGLAHIEGRTGAVVTNRKEDSDGLNSPRAGAGRTGDDIKNFHPTVKPLKLMRWLCRLLTPQGGTVLDPFLGSGTTACGAIIEGFHAVGCEMTDDYFELIEARVEDAKRQYVESFKE